MKKFKQHTLNEYTTLLSKKTPTPGGGSASALAGALGVSLLEMVAHYSKGKGRSKQVEVRVQKTIKEAGMIRKRLLDLVDEDARAYEKVVKARKKSKTEYNKALKAASKVPKEVCKLCYKAVNLAPFLVREGNKHLVADVQVATELLYSSYNGALILSDQ